jgi:hypothetical protein
LVLAESWKVLQTQGHHHWGNWYVMKYLMYNLGWLNVAFFIRHFGLWSFGHPFAQGQCVRKPNSVWQHWMGHWYVLSMRSLLPFADGAE